MIVSIIHILDCNIYSKKCSLCWFTMNNNNTNNNIDYY